MWMAVLSVWRAENIPGEHAAIRLKPSAAHHVYQYLVWHRIDRIRHSSDRPHFRPHAVLQSGGGAACGVGGSRNGGDADLRCDLRPVDWRMVGSHALAMGPAPS